MSAKSEIVAKVEEVYGVSNPVVYRGLDYDGHIQAHGWWYKQFDQRAFFLGKSKSDAMVTLIQIQEERADTRP